MCKDIDFNNGFSVATKYTFDTFKNTIIVDFRGAKQTHSLMEGAKLKLYYIPSSCNNRLASELKK